MGRPVFTCSLPGGAILPSSPPQLRHRVCNLEKSYICMMCNCLSFIKIPVMESRDLLSVSRRVSRPVFWVLVSVSKVSGLGLEGFRSRSRALRLETLRMLFFMKFFKKEFLKENGLKNDWSKFSHSKRSVAKLSLWLCCSRDRENNLPSTPFKIYTEFNKKYACNKETAMHNLCNERLEELC